MPSVVGAKVERRNRIRSASRLAPLMPAGVTQSPDHVSLFRLYIVDVFNDFIRRSAPFVL